MQKKLKNILLITMSLLLTVMNIAPTYANRTYIQDPRAMDAEGNYNIILFQGETDEDTAVKVTLDKQGGTGGTAFYFDKSNVSYAEQACSTEITSVDVPTKQNDTFLGYFDAEEGGTEIISADGTISDTGKTYITDTTLYAQWLPENIVKVTLDKQGGTGGTPFYFDKNDTAYSEQVCANSITTVEVPTKQNNTFLGYFDAEEGGNMIIGDDGTISDTGKSYTTDITLYAHWEPALIVKVTLNKKGGTGGTPFYYDKENESYAEAVCTNVIASVEVPTKLNYIFLGYFDEEDGGSEIISNTGVISATGKSYIEAKTLYAHWEKEPIFKVTLNKTGGSGGTSFFWDKYNESYDTVNCTRTISDISLPTRRAYTFNGYYSEREGGEEVIGADGIITATAKSYTEDTVLYAHWTPVPKCKITLRKNGGAGGTNFYYVSEGYTYANSLLSSEIFDIENPIRNGYEFTGYYADETLTGDPVIAPDGTGFDTTKTYTVDTTLYAGWEALPKPDSCKVILKKQGGAGGTGFYYDAKIDGTFKSFANSTLISEITSVDLPTRVNYTFKGYFDDPDEGNEIIGADGVISDAGKSYTEETTLYAHWESTLGNIVTVRLNANGGLNGNPIRYYLASGVSGKAFTTKSCVIEVNIVATPTKVNNTFLGFYTEKDGGNKVIDEFGNISAEAKAYTEDTVLYAHWLPIPKYKITLDKQGGTGGTPFYFVANEHTYANQTLLTEIYDIDNPARVNYEFTGYYADAECTGDPVIAPNGDGFDVTKSYTEDTTLYAGWEALPKPDSCRINLKKQGGTGGTSFFYDAKVDDNYKAFSTKMLATEINTVDLPTRHNYNFLGYFDIAEDEDAEGNPAVQIIGADGSISDVGKSYTEETTLYAHWESTLGDIVTVRLSANGGIGQMPARYYLATSLPGVAFTSKSCINEITNITVPTKVSGLNTYELLGYLHGSNTSEDIVGDYIDATGAISAEGMSFTTDTTIIADWQPAYAVRFIAKNELGEDYDFTGSGMYAPNEPLVVPTDIPANYEDTDYVYTFKAWSPVPTDGTPVTRGMTFRAQYNRTEKTKYTVLFKNWDGTVLNPDTKTYYDGDNLIVPAEPTRPEDDYGIYTFTGWDTTPVSPVHANATYTAQYSTDPKSGKYEIIFKNWDGTELSKNQYDPNETVNQPPTPTRPDDDKYTYIFKAWTPTFSSTAVKSETYTATYTAKAKPGKHTVIFKNWDNTVLSKKVYDTGDIVEVPAEPTRPEDDNYTYIFKAWSPTVVNTAVKDMTYTATYTAKSKTGTTCVIIFKDWDGTTISNKAYDKGDTITVPSDPIRSSDSNYNYTFTGWSPAINKIATEDKTYTAQYNRTSRYAGGVNTNQNTTITPNTAYPPAFYDPSVKGTNGSVASTIGGVAKNIQTGVKSHAGLFAGISIVTIAIAIGLIIWVRKRREDDNFEEDNE